MNCYYDIRHDQKVNTLNHFIINSIAIYYLNSLIKNLE